MDAQLHKILSDAFDRVHEAASEYIEGWRLAAYAVALARLESAYTGRGIFP